MTGPSRNESSQYEGRIPRNYSKRYHFSNGWGASVICGPHTDGGQEGLFEIAVLRGDRICYDTDITDNVLGYQTHQNVHDVLERIKALPPAS